MRAQSWFPFTTALAVVILWIASLFIVCGVVPVSGWAVGFGSGSLWLEHPVAGDDSAVQWFARVESGMPSLWFAHEKAANWENWSMPLWPTAAIAIALGVPRRRRCLHPGLCGYCGNDRSGIEIVSVCPECGTSVSPVTSTNPPL